MCKDELRALEALGQLLVRRLLDDTRTCEGDERVRLSEVRECEFDVYHDLGYRLHKQDYD